VRLQRAPGRERIEYYFEDDHKKIFSR